MAQADKGMEIHIVEINGGEQTQSSASPKSWISQVKSTFNPSYRMWQVSQNVCIYRVIEVMRISKAEAYVPLVVSLGPYHHGTNPKFSIMDQYKVEAVHRLLKRVNISITRLIEVIQELESRVRECYAEPIEWDGETLSWMLAMDACFVLEFFRNRKENDTDCFSLVFQSKKSKNPMFYAILTDIIKLENQIPLFILINILQLEFGTSERAKMELAAMLSPFKTFSGSPFSLSNGAESELKNQLEKKPGPCHLLDLYRMVITRDLLTNPNAESNIIDDCDASGGADSINYEWSWQTINAEEKRYIPHVELLLNAGIKFQRGCQLKFEKIKFGASTLSLPPMKISVHTETRLRNLMAYEEWQKCTSPSEKTVISAYVRLFDNLIESEKDVSLLRKFRIIRSWKGSDEDIARMFNRLCDGIQFSSIPEINKVLIETREHYYTQWKVWIHEFKEENCSKPWYVVPLVAGILILGMTAVQTVYSVNQ